MQVHCGKSEGKKMQKCQKSSTILLPGFNPNTEEGRIGFIIALSLSTQAGNGCDQGGVGVGGSGGGLRAGLGTVVP